MAGPPPAERPEVTRVGPVTFQPSPKRVRAFVGGTSGTAVADSEETLLAWEQGRMTPVYLFPAGDVATELLSPAANPRHGAHHDLAEQWDLTLGERRIPGAAWSYSRGQVGEALGDYIAVEPGALDTWLEEQERVIGHPRDPYHRVDLRRSERQVRIGVDGRTLAESRHPLLVFETDLPTQYYLPPEDVATELLAESGTRTVCPYKGQATYYSADIGDRTVPDIAWVYADPLPESGRLAGFVAFTGSKVDTEVDGKPVST
jgi:uncharacterized protein (DUF427 family)